MNGPWKWSEDGLQIIDATGRTVLRIRPSDATEEEFRGLISVPELLAACRFIVAHECVNQPCPMCYRKAKEAIGRVTGGDES
jgi:hypothetical protein